MLLRSLLLTLVLSAIAAAQEPLVIDNIILRLLAEAQTPAQTPGVLLKIAVREGDEVAAGQVLANIDDGPIRLEAKGAKIAADIAKQAAENDVKVRFATKSHEVAVAELARSEESITRFANSVSQSQLDVERLTVEKTALEQEQAREDQAAAKLKYASKQNDLAAAELEVARRQITAPFAGVVVEVTARAGEWVEPGQKVLRLVNVERLKAEGFVSASDAQRMTVGAAVALKLTGDSATHAGKIVFISPEVDPVSNQVRFWAEIDNRTRALRPGESATLQVQPSKAAR